MILNDRRVGPLVYRKRWFARRAYDAEPLLTMYPQFLGEEPPPGWKVEPFVTVLNPLDADRDGLLARMKKGTAYEIRRAEEKDGVRFLEDLPPDDFLRFYNGFARRKGLGVLGPAHLGSLGDHGWTSGVHLGTVLVAVHAYVLDPEEGRARLLYSAQAQEGAVDRAALGRANRWLHLRDMLALQARGFWLYDWGGITEPGSDPEREGITQFKLGFGGEVSREWTCYSPVLTLARRISGRS